MNISSRFSVAVHMLSLLDIGKDLVCTSEIIATSVNTNPVVIRRVTGMLKKAGLVSINTSCGGANLLKPIEEITLLDVYKAVEVVKEGQLFKIHEDSDPNCAVGSKIHFVLEEVLHRTETAMERELKNVTIADIVEDILKLNRECKPKNI
ncbi:Rrf2 family transcriptional regulator [Clostridium saccharoperbutylacetonicum]|uniref:Rrf2 family transcriptional regulator n=1 Tax=Clostridium saccharoperbutylacetonicum TaxID=36745 RepID=UPI0039E8F3FB